MSNTRGEGRSSAEKSQRVVVPYAERKAARERRLAEEAAWAAQSGPVTTVHPTRQRQLDLLERREAMQHWLVFDLSIETPSPWITGCQCGFVADVDSDMGFGDSVVDHLLSVAAERVDRG